MTLERTPQRLTLADSAAAMALILTGCGTSAPSQAVDVARNGLRAVVPGISVGEVSRSEVDDGCALVELETSRGVDKVGVVRQPNHGWSPHKIATDTDDYFDLDYTD